MARSRLANPRVMKKLGFLSLVLGLAVSLSACVTNPATGKKSFIVLSQAQENQMGSQAYQEMLAKERLSSDPRLNAMLLRVGKRIASVVPANFQWEFKLIESKE